MLKLFASVFIILHNSPRIIDFTDGIWNRENLYDIIVFSSPIVKVSLYFFFFHRLHFIKSKSWLAIISHGFPFFLKNVTLVIFKINWI